MTPVRWEPAGLQSLLEGVRRLNVAALAKAVGELDEPFVEPALRDDDGEVLGEGEFDLPLRADVVPCVNGEPGESMMVTPPTHLEFEPMAARVGGVGFTLEPFGWDYANVTARVGAGEELDVGPLLDWFDEWFDADDAREADAQGLHGVVHYLSDPELQDDVLEFTVDLGSAPVEAFAGLVAALGAIGATDIRIRTPWGDADE